MSKNKQKALPGVLKFFDILAIIILVIVTATVFILKSKNSSKTAMHDMFGYKYGTVQNTQGTEYSENELIIAKTDYAYKEGDTVVFLFQDVNENINIGKSSTLGIVQEAKDVNTYIVKAITGEEITVVKSSILGKVLSSNAIAGTIYTLIVGPNSLLYLVVPTMVLVLTLIVISIVTVSSRKKRMKRYSDKNDYDFDNSILKDNNDNYQMDNNSFDVFNSNIVEQKNDNIEYAFKNGVMQEEPEEPVKEEAYKGFNPMAMQSQPSQTSDRFNGNRVTHISEQPQQQNQVLTQIDLNQNNNQPDINNSFIVNKGFNVQEEEIELVAHPVQDLSKEENKNEIKFENYSEYESLNRVPSKEELFNITGGIVADVEKKIVEEAIVVETEKTTSVKEEDKEGFITTIKTLYTEDDKAIKTADEKAKDYEALKEYLKKLK